MSATTSEMAGVKADSPAACALRSRLQVEVEARRLRRASTRSQARALTAPRRRARAAAPAPSGCRPRPRRRPRPRSRAAWRPRPRSRRPPAACRVWRATARDRLDVVAAPVDDSESCTKTARIFGSFVERRRPRPRRDTASPRLRLERPHVHAVRLAERRPALAEVAGDERQHRVARARARSRAPLPSRRSPSTRGSGRRSLVLRNVFSPATDALKTARNSSVRWWTMGRASASCTTGWSGVGPGVNSRCFLIIFLFS